MTISAALVDRFRNDLEALTGPLDGIRLGVAVSGGPDSVALLLLAHATYPGCVHAATVDHRLRPASAAEALGVATLCAKMSVPHAILTVAQMPSGNISANARDARYRAIDSWVRAERIDLLATAHHADDQLETMIMRLNRGSGVSGLAGVRALRGYVVRPLLGWRKAELAEIVAAAGVTPADDPTNRDDRFDRARLRKALAGADWLDPVAASHSAAALADAEKALDWCAEAFGPEYDEAGRLTLDTVGLPRELVRRCLLLAIRVLAPRAMPRGEQIEAAIAALSAGETTTLAGIVMTGGPRWTFAPAPPRRTTRQAIRTGIVH